jgi:hypothetical protein
MTVLTEKREIVNFVQKKKDKIKYEQQKITRTLLDF